VLSTYAAAEPKKGYVTADIGLFVRKTPTSKKDNKLVYNGENVLLYEGHEVSIIETVDSDNDSDNPTWHHIKFKYNNAELEGYVTTKYIRVVEAPSGDIEMPEGIPEIYKEYIEELLKYHP
jgi:hypothetical protein